MPCLKSPISLQEGCIDNVVDNIEKWCNLYTKEYGANKLDHLDVDGPFDSLPSTFLEQIIHILWQKDLLKRHHLEFLVTTELKTLDLNCCCLDQKDILGLYGFLHLSSIRCPNLEDLTWNSSFQKSISLLQIFLPMFKKLQVLNIQNTKTGDSCLLVLGAYCKELRVLVARGCRDVTDVGIKGLCAAFDELGREIPTLGQCKSIHTLRLEETGITKKGVQLAIENLPALRIFGFDYPVLILAQLHEECKLPNYPLVSELDGEGFLGCSWDVPSLPYKSGSLLRVATLCSSLNKVNLQMPPGLTDQELLGLLQLRSLCELAIYSGQETCEITFDGGVVPLLKAFGNSLTSLSIIEVDGLPVNIRAIVVYCPKLESLNLEDCGDYLIAPLDEEQNSVKRMKKDLILENLKVLDIECGTKEEYNISSEGLDMLLSSPALVKLNLDGCRTLDDCILRKALDLHQFRNLESLRISYCHNVTEQGIYLLLNEDNPLAFLEIEDCNLFKMEFGHKLENLALQKNWDIEFKCWSLDH